MLMIVARVVYSSRPPSHARSPLISVVAVEEAEASLGGRSDGVPEECAPDSCYNARMRIAPGRVVDGRVELDAELPEGASVTVLALEGDETFEADAETERMLLEAIGQCDRGQTTPMTGFLADLRSRE